MKPPRLGRSELPRPPRPPGTDLIERQRGLAVDGVNALIGTIAEGGALAGRLASPVELEYLKHIRALAIELYAGRASAEELLLCGRQFTLAGHRLRAKQTG